MRITVFKEREQKLKTISFSGKTVHDLLRQLKINPEVVIVVKNDEVLTGQDILKEHDKVDILSVISGG